MDAFAVFVDAGYLFAEGGKLTHGTSDRQGLELDFRATVSALADIGRKGSGARYLRTYWYDAATDATPRPSHLVLAAIPGVKLRLGRLSGGRQKGVDSRIVRDLIVLARHRAISAAYVLSGDEDIREGVAEAQEQGVSVCLLGITPLPGQSNQARSLVQEADDLVLLTREDIAPWLRLRVPQSPRVISAPSSVAASVHWEQIGRRFGEEWVVAHSGALPYVVSVRPNIPQEVDRELLASASAEIGAQLTAAQRRSLRHGFWTAVDGASSARDSS